MALDQRVAPVEVPAIGVRPGRPPRVRGVPPALALTLSAAAVAVAALAGINSPKSVGPLYLTNGSREVTATTGVALNGVSGQVVTIAMPISAGHDTIVLESATLLPLPGYPTPQLTDLGVYRGQMQGPSATPDWPPRDTNPAEPSRYSGPLPVAPINGFKVGPTSSTQGAPSSYFIYFGVTGQQVGVNYVTAGLRVVYRIGGEQYETNLYQMGEVCVRSSLQDPWNTDMNALSTEFKLYGGGGSQ